jgi:hypothetical protein
MWTNYRKENVLGYQIDYADKDLTFSAIGSVVQRRLLEGIVKARKGGIR